MRELDTGMIHWRRIAERDPAGRAIGLVGNDGHAELRMTVGKAAYIPDVGFWSRLVEGAVAVYAQLRLADHGAALAPMLLVAAGAALPSSRARNGPISAADFGMGADFGVTRQAGIVGHGGERGAVAGLAFGREEPVRIGDFPRGSTTARPR